MSFSSQDVYKKALGRCGEKRVAEFLKARGLKILKKNYVKPFGGGQGAGRNCVYRSENAQFGFLRNARRGGGNEEAGKIPQNRRVLLDGNGKRTEREV